jgi:hypothetical protein
MFYQIGSSIHFRILNLLGLNSDLSLAADCNVMDDNEWYM